MDRHAAAKRAFLRSKKAAKASTRTTGGNRSGRSTAPVKKGRNLLKDDAASLAYARARGETTKGAVAIDRYAHNVNSQESGGNRYK